MPPQTLLFEHLPKTAGSSLRYLFRRYYRHNHIYTFNWSTATEQLHAFKSLPEEKKQSIQLIEGHGSSCLLPFFGDCYTLTFLRHPVERFVSQYRFVNEYTKHRSHKKAHSLEAYLEYAVQNQEDNLQTRYLSNHALAFMEGGEFIGETPSIDKLHKEALAKLWSFDFVFLSHQFNEALLILKQELDWHRMPFYVVKNRTKQGNERLILSDDLRLQIEEVERYDMKLYAQAMVKSDMLLNRHNLGEEIDAFKRSNESRRWRTKLEYYLAKIVGK